MDSVPCCDPRIRTLKTGAVGRAGRPAASPDLSARGKLCVLGQKGTPPTRPFIYLSLNPFPAFVPKGTEVKGNYHSILLGK